MELVQNMFPYITYPWGVVFKQEQNTEDIGYLDQGFKINSIRKKNSDPRL